MKKITLQLLTLGLLTLLVIPSFHLHAEEGTTTSTTTPPVITPTATTTHPTTTPQQQGKKKDDGEHDGNKGPQHKEQPRPGDPKQPATTTPAAPHTEDNNHDGDKKRSFW